MVRNSACPRTLVFSSRATARPVARLSGTPIMNVNVLITDRVKAHVSEKTHVIIQSHERFLRSDNIPLMEADVEGEPHSEQGEDREVDQSWHQKYIC